MQPESAFGPFQRLWRYYQAGIVNTLFGYGLFAVFIAMGFNMYVAQVTAHVLGACFNYITYSRHAFNDSEASKPRFILSYAINYLLGLASLAALSQVIHSPYIAGAAAVIIVSLINYFILKHFVFTPKREM